MKDAVFAAAGSTLHILTEEGLLCDATDWQIVDHALFKDSLLCGTCVDSWQIDKVIDPRFDPFPIDTAEELRQLPYREYLKTHHWHIIRRAALDHYGNACLLCGETGKADVHHRTYERRGQERLHDLTILCRDCHGRFHEAA
ncbi:MAG: hypothetical protein H0U59_09565 [Gemmatimonadaceae bacterium]|nr:hypothetical protein [Gemmatimonadaceae bacterium]